MREPQVDGEWKSIRGKCVTLYVGGHQPERTGSRISPSLPIDNTLPQGEEERVAMRRERRRGGMLDSSPRSSEGGLPLPYIRQRNFRNPNLCKLAFQGLAGSYS